MRVAHVLRRLVPEEWGGIETMVSAIARRQRQRGSEVLLCCTSALSRPGREDVEGVELRRFDYHYPVLGMGAEQRRGLDRLGGNPYAPGLMRHLARDFRPDLVHCHVPGRLAAGALAVARRLDVPFVLSLHGGLDAGTQSAVPVRETPRRCFNWGRLVDPFLGVNAVLERADAILTVAPEEVDQLVARGTRGLVRHLPNGVDPSRVRGGVADRVRQAYALDPEIPLLLMMARIVPQKDQLLALECLARVREWTPAQLALVGPVGDVSYRSALDARARELGVSDAVRIVPPVRHGSEAFRDWWNAADLFLMPSRHEPFGIGVLEAWAAEIPVISSRAGGLATLVQDGMNGRSIGRRDPIAWAAAVLELLQRPERRARLVANGRAELEARHGWSAVEARLHELYSALRASRQRHAAMARKEGVS